MIYIHGEKIGGFHPKSIHLKTGVAAFWFPPVYFSIVHRGFPARPGPQLTPPPGQRDEQILCAGDKKFLLNLGAEGMRLW